MGYVLGDAAPGLAVFCNQLDRKAAPILLNSQSHWVVLLEPRWIGLLQMVTTARVPM